MVGVGISSVFWESEVVVAMLALDASVTSTSRFRYSEVSIDIGGVSSDRTLVFGSRISDAGVTGALNPFCVVVTAGFSEPVFRRGGGAIRTSGSGSGDTDSFEEPSRLCGICIGVFCSDAGVNEPFLVALRGVPGYVCCCACWAKEVANFGVSGGGGRFLCGFILGDSRTTRAGFRDCVTDFRRPLLLLPFFPMAGDSSDSSIGCICAGRLCDICGLGMWVRCWWALSAGDVKGLKAPGITKSGMCRVYSVSRGVTAGDTRGVKIIFSED
jgi:hypothetical protein